VWLKKKIERNKVLQGLVVVDTVGEIKFNQATIDDMLEKENLKWK
jgi:hypothetical protein